MRIAFIVGQFPKLSETFILNQATGLIDRGHQVDIFYEYEGDWEHVHPDVNRYNLRQHAYKLEPIPQNYWERSLKGLGLLLKTFPKAPGLIARSLNVFAYGGQAAGLWLLYSAVALLDRPTYDVIHCQFGTHGYRGLTFKRLLQPTPKLLLMFRGHDISAYVAQGGGKTYQKLIHHVDYCLANCEFFRQRAIALGWQPEQVGVHFSGLDVQKFKFRPRRLEPGAPIRIATTGRLEEKKGIEYAIRAVADQSLHHQNLHYVIIGDGSLRPSLEALIRELKAESYIHLLGWQDEAAIIETLDTCHLFIAPSVTAADGNQDAPINVLKEAMMIGLPVISTHHGGIPELVQDGVSGFLVPERDATALSDRLGYLLDHPERWEEMGLAGRRFVEEHFNLDNLNDRLVTVYDRLVHDPMAIAPNTPSKDKDLVGIHHSPSH
jgi:colanic acid/amylovoran biosynthesis glycosyltransferase